jgi:hypothetical protein
MIIVLTVQIKTGHIDDNWLILSEGPLWVARKLEWNPLQPSTPPPRSTKLLGLLWKNDCRTNKQPLQAKRYTVKDRIEPSIISAIFVKYALWIAWNSYILLSWVLPQNNVNHSNCFLTVLWFLTSQGQWDCTHRNFCRIREFDLISLRIVGPSDPFPVTSRRTVIGWTAICRSPESKKAKLAFRDNYHQSR